VLPRGEQQAGENRAHHRPGHQLGGTPLHRHRRIEHRSATTADRGRQRDAQDADLGQRGPVRREPLGPGAEAGLGGTDGRGALQPRGTRPHGVLQRPLLVRHRDRHVPPSVGRSV
jgi:hypothetical protein